HTFDSFLLAYAARRSYVPGPPVRKARPSSASSFCRAPFSGELAASSGVVVSVLQPSLHGAGLGLYERFRERDACAWRFRGAPAISATHKRAASKRMSIGAGGFAKRALDWRAASSRRETEALTVLRRRSVGVFAESVRITVRQNLHHPAIEVVDW